MAGIVKLVVDEAVYEYSCYAWGLIAKDNPKSVVCQLSEGKGVTPKKESKTNEDLLELMQRSVLFLPRVRMREDYGYRNENARWHKFLLNKKRSLKGKVVYLTEAVNQLIQKPNIDKIAKLRQTISQELQAQKSNIQLSSEQSAKVDEVNSKIAEQKKVLRGLPRCTNQILTTLLHEYVDVLSADDAASISNYLIQIDTQEQRIKATNANLELPDIKNNSDRKLEQENIINNAVSKIKDYRKQCTDIRTKYYEKFRLAMTPQAIARQLTTYAATSWEAFNIKTKMIEVNMKVSAPAKPSNDDDGKPVRKEPTLVERVEKLLLFPLSVAEGQLDKEFMEGLANDLKVTAEWDEWARKSEAKEFTPEYKSTYEEFRRRLRTIPPQKAPKKDEKPENEEETPSSPSQTQLNFQVSMQPTATTMSSQDANNSSVNYDMLYSFMKARATKLEYGSRDINDSSNITKMKEFSERADFATVFQTLKENIDSCKTFGNAMQYIRNVVLRNQTYWSTTSVG